ncbi:zinc transporter 6-like [Anneissia japonica]|uniref:zinc transporter 6-like n=1 Tax=Anneissia japonica TaxID=1529436 RepID=UPI001425A256|nr:zinc transporter 6-like [Anneissia japonica]
MASDRLTFNVKTSTLQDQNERFLTRKMAYNAMENNFGHSSYDTMKRQELVALDIDAPDMSMDIASTGGGVEFLSADLRQRGTTNGSTKGYISGTIQPFSRNQTGIIGRVVQEWKSLAGKAQTRRLAIFSVFTVICILVLLIWCNSTGSMALTAYTNLLIFDLTYLGTALVSIWVRQQKSSSSFSFGYERFEVLAVFASTMLAIFGAVFIMKESTELLLKPEEVHTGRLLLGAGLGFFCHIFVIYGVKNVAFDHVIAASSSSWLQVHFADMSRSFCSVLPGLDRLLLPRVNPLMLIGLAGGVALFIVDLLVDVNNYYVADILAAYSIALMICGTMFPMSVYSGTILLQTTPEHIIGQLDKSLREASTLDGVLEFRNEHFWTLSFGTLAGSLHVRVRRDADEQLVLAHVANKLSNLVFNLTIQVIKDDWTRPSSMAGFTRGTLKTFTSLPPPAPLSSNISTVYNPREQPYQLASGIEKEYKSAFLSTPTRASSTPHGTPMKDLSFHSNLEPISNGPQQTIPSITSRYAASTTVGLSAFASNTYAEANPSQFRANPRVGIDFSKPYLPKDTYRVQTTGLNSGPVSSRQGAGTSFDMNSLGKVNFYGAEGSRQPYVNRFTENR